MTSKDTSCFQMGFDADRPSAAKPLSAAAAVAVVDAPPGGKPAKADGGVLLADGGADCRLRDDTASSYGRDLVIAPSAPSAVEDVLRDRTTGTPLTSFSVSLVGSRLTNSLCSNWTTTYGRARGDLRLRPRAWMSLTCSWPFDEDEGELRPLRGCDWGTGWACAGDCSCLRGGGGCLISNSGGCMESWVVGRAALKAALGVRAPLAEARGVMGDWRPESRLADGFRDRAAAVPGWALFAGRASKGFLSCAGGWEAFGVTWSAGPEGQSLIAAIGLRTAERYDDCCCWGLCDAVSVGVVAGDDDETRDM